MFISAALFALFGIASAGSVLWDGRMNEYETSAFLDQWSWSNQVGPYQWYIHGSGKTSDYVNLSSEFRNPADSGSNQGVQITIDETSSWNGQTMLRTELIPQTTAAINKGKVFYHFSMQHTATIPPPATEEHQICFFESHFTEMKYGSPGSFSTQLQWFANSESHWNMTLEAGVWHNIAYGIDFDAQTVAFYHSTGADDLTMAAGPVSATTSSNGADWHLGVLKLPSSSGNAGAAAEDWHFSGVYIEDGDITKAFSSGANSSSTPSTTTVASRLASPTATTLRKVTRAAPSTTSTSNFLIPASFAGSPTTSRILNGTSSTTSMHPTFPSSVAVAANPAPTFSDPTTTLMSTISVASSSNAEQPTNDAGLTDC